MRTTVLCTSVGNDGFQAVHRALKAAAWPIKIVGVDADPYAYGVYIADRGYVVPRRNDPEALVSELIDICRQEKVELLLPLSTEDQSFFATHRRRFEDERVVVAVSPLHSVTIANDKHLLFTQCAKRDLPIPAYRHVSSLPELEITLSEFDAEHSPIVVRKAFSTGAIGVKVVRPDIPTDERFFSRDNIVITLEDLRRWSAHLDPFPSLQVCEYLPDASYSVDVFLNRGKSQCAVVRRELVRLYGMSTVGVTIDRTDIEAVGVAVAEALELEYTVNVEVGL